MALVLNIIIQKDNYSKQPKATATTATPYQHSIDHQQQQPQQ